MVPSQPTITQLSVKAADSMPSCSATGQPNRFISLKSALVRELCRISRLYSPKFLPVISMPTIASAIRIRLTSVEIPAPSKPSSGKPATP